MSIRNADGILLAKTDLIATMEEITPDETYYTAGEDIYIRKTLDGATAFEGGLQLLYPAGTIVPLAKINSLFVAPTVTSIVPSSDYHYGGIEIAVIGAGFAGATGATINGVAVTNFELIDDTTFTCTTPSNIGTGGAVDFVLNDDSGDVTFTDAFTLNGRTITVTDCSPSDAAYYSETDITITGTGFVYNGHNIPTLITINGETCSFSVTNSTTIAATYQNTESGVGTFDVVVSAASPNTGATLTDGFVAHKAELDAEMPLSPDEGTESGFTSVTINGEYLAGVTGVTFGGTPGTSFAAYDTEIHVTTPAGTGLVDVVLVDALGGNVTLEDAFTYIP